MITLLATIAVLSAPTPEVCRQHNVAVEDGSQATGIVVESTRVKRRDVPPLCQGQRGGCALVVWPGYDNTPSEWVIVHSSDYSEQHEICHSIYATAAHVK